MVKINPVKRITLTEQIMERIAEIIIQGKIKPGGQLPNERELSELFKVTRSSVREALRALSLIGLISIKPGEGSFVNEHVMIPSKTISWMYRNEINNINEVYDARKLIETEVFLSAYELCTNEHLKKMEELTRKIVQASQNDIEPEKFLTLLDDYDIYMGKICGNKIYYKLMQTVIHLRSETSLKILKLPGAKEQSTNNRLEMLKSFKSNNRRKVEESIQSFYLNSRQFYEIISEKISDS